MWLALPDDPTVIAFRALSFEHEGKSMLFKIGAKRV